MLSKKIKSGLWIDASDLFAALPNVHKVLLDCLPATPDTMNAIVLVRISRILGLIENAPDSPDTMHPQVHHEYLALCDRACELERGGVLLVDLEG